MSVKQKIIINHVKANGKITKKEATEMLKKGLIKRESKGVYTLGSNTNSEPQNQGNLF